MAVPQTLGPRVALHALNRLGYGPRPGRSGGARPRPRDVRGSRTSSPPAPTPSSTRACGRSPPSTTRSRRCSRSTTPTTARSASILDEFYDRAPHPRRPRAEPAAGSAGRLLVQPLQRLHRRRLRPLQRSRATSATPSARTCWAASATCWARCRAPGDALLPRQLPEPRRARRAGVVGGINENYGRELLELHTVGVDAGYTQNDVQRGRARASPAGASTTSERGQLRVPRRQARPRREERLRPRLPAGGGKEDGERLLDYLATPSRDRPLRLPEARRSASSPTIRPTRVVDRMARTPSCRTGGDLREVMRTIVGTAEFWAEAFGGGKVKTPLRVRGERAARRRGPRSRTRRVARRAARPTMGMPLYGSVPPRAISNRGIGLAATRRRTSRA